MATKKKPAPKRWAKVELDSDGMGDATEEDFAAYCTYVADHIDELAGFPVEVDAAPFGKPGAATKASDDETALEVDFIVQDLWDMWCAEGAADASD